MRKVRLEIDTVRLRVSALKGCRVKMLVNRGRKRIVKMTGEVLDIYPSVFTVKVDGLKSAEILSYSYSDVLCGDVRLAAVPPEEKLAD